MAQKDDERYKYEKHFQVDAFTWTWNTYPQYRRLFFKVHNEGKKHIIAANQDKAEGIVPGIPDLVFVHPLMGIELKADKGYQKPSQKRVQESWEAVGITYHIVWTMGEYKAIIQKACGDENINY